MPKALAKYIESNPEVLGGIPVVKGTRIPVERIKYLVRQGYTTQTLAEEYPQIAPKKIQFIISYLMEAGLDAFEKTQKVQTSSR
jgi:uncharacterized protein (DUF433 family)